MYIYVYITVALTGFSGVHMSPQASNGDLSVSLKDFRVISFSPALHFHFCMTVLLKDTLTVIYFYLKENLMPCFSTLIFYCSSFYFSLKKD